MCGWTKDNHALREEFIHCIDADVISICETHLTNNDVINIDSYTWFGFNRQDIHRNAPKGSGGVGLLVRNSLLDVYSAEIVDKQFDGILALKLVHNDTETEFCIFSCYLPPEHSTRGRDAQSLFAHLLSLIYMYGDCDYMYIAGNFNA